MRLQAPPSEQLNKKADDVASHPSNLRQLNTRQLLRLLRIHNPCSKADLARLSGLSAPTVSTAVSHLEMLGLVDYLGEGVSSGGRPPGLLRFRANRGYVAGADIGGTRLRMILADLNGRIVSQWSTSLSEKQKTPRVVCSLVEKGLRSMCEEGAIPWKRVLHLTAGAPGITNVKSGVVISAPNLRDWHQIPLRNMLTEQIGIPVQVENDTNLAALGEHWCGAAEGVANFLFVALGTGVGAGVFLDGRLHQGSHWSAGEIGYLQVAGRELEPLRVRSTGQLERSIGGEAIEAEWARLLKSSGSLVDPALLAMHVPQIFDLAANGHPIATEVILYTARILSTCLSQVALLLDPELIILGGGVGAHPELCRQTVKLLQQNEFAHPTLKTSALGTNSQLHGAISLSLSSIEGKLVR